MAANEITMSTRRTMTMMIAGAGVSGGTGAVVYPSPRLTVSRRLVAKRAFGYSHGTNVGEPRNHVAGSVYGFGRHLDGDEFRWKNTGLDNFLKRCTRVKAGIFPVCLLRCARKQLIELQFSNNVAGTIARLSEIQQLFKADEWAIYYGLWYPIVIAGLTVVVGLLFLPETFRRKIHD